MTDPQKPQAVPIQHVSYNMILTLGSWLFLIGSLIFQIDAILEWVEGISIHAVFHLFGSFLFMLGSILFVIHDSQA